MGTHTGNVITLSNSIIGVSVLAMPFCFKQCGIVLAIFMLLFSNIITRLACHYLMKSAILEKRKNFEMLAFRVYGPTGKLIVELCIIGFMLGTCVAYFVIMGDLGPGIIGPGFGFQQPSALRPSVLIAVAVFVVLPLGLLKNVDSLSAVCAATIAFYFCLVLKVMGEAINHLIERDWVEKVYYWRPSGILQCIPIFSMALSCQTQLFEIFDPIPSNPLDRMNGVVKSAINMVTLFYISVGFFGYIAYCDQTFSGNLMMNFSPTMTSDVIKIGFLLSVAVSFPLVIFPCRASIHSLLFSKGYEHAQTGSAHIPESRFKCITLVIVTISLITGLLIPNIEIVLGLVGSTIGVIICVIIPGVLFISLSMRNNNERLVAKFLVCTGVVIMVLGTYANLYATEEAVSGPERNSVLVKKDDSPAFPKILEKVEIKDETLQKIKDVDELAALPELKPIQRKGDALPLKEAVNEIKEVKKIDLHVPIETKVVEDSKKEPPIPEEPGKIPQARKEPLLPKEPQPIPKVQESLVPREVEKKEPPEEVPKVEKNIPNSKFTNSNDSKKEQPDHVEPSDVDKPSKKKDIEEPNKIENVKDSPIVDKKSESVFSEIIKNNLGDGKENEKIIEKIKEHEEAQRKLNEEGVQLLKEIKDYVNFTKDSLKLVNVKTGLVTDIKPNSTIGNVMEVNNSQKDLANNIAKGIPLPLAVKGQLLVDEKEKDINKNKENEVVDKHDIGRDLLAREHEERLKRDVEEVLKEISVERTPSPKIEQINSSLSTKSKVGPTVASSSNGVLKAVDDKNNDEGTLSKLKAGLENCVKNDSNKVQNQVDKIIANENKMDDLIKSPSYLSNTNSVLNRSPPLLSGEVNKDGVPEMPKKRDLKSISSEDFPENKQDKKIS